MIKLSRLDGEPFVLNADLIRYVERRPDTFITLTSGERIVVRESLDEVVDRAVRYQQHKHWMPNPQIMLRPEIGLPATDMTSNPSACPTS
ncbi:Flagellar protein (FlbD) [Novipirellula aureliae]|uniref:Flagellar protein (FlbD) n=1 Tax=Novipirellula aureliae TaxID=2527966 RepID=A0A5C6E330_9BACT|nr:flagellar FlbD family protein [Novipirellula aureliae]TWU43320.1 Flagellar protein (FlbD) [Novipirellula aureliae]